MVHDCRFGSTVSSSPESIRTLRSLFPDFSLSKTNSLVDGKSIGLVNSTKIVLSAEISPICMSGGSTPPPDAAYFLAESRCSAMSPNRLLTPLSSRSVKGTSSKIGSVTTASTTTAGNLTTALPGAAAGRLVAAAAAGSIGSSDPDPAAGSSIVSGSSAGGGS